jgi:hypothetical protein
MLKVLPVIALLTVGCSFGPNNLQSKHSTDLEARKIHRIAVLPPIAAPSVPAVKTPLGPAPDPQAAERNAAEHLAKYIYSAMSSLPNWQIVSDSEIREVEQPLGPTAEAMRLRRLGEMVYADAVIAGRIQRYRERIGDEWGAESPASVAFILELVDARRGDVIWTARFDETQKSLSENIFAIGDIGQRGIRWLTADQLAEEGVKKAIGQLHEIIARTSVR